METSTRLALEAIVLGLRRSGTIHDHAMVVIIDELRDASRRAREGLNDHGSEQIERLATALQEEGKATTMLELPSKTIRDTYCDQSTSVHASDHQARSLWFLGIPFRSWQSRKRSSER